LTIWVSGDDVLVAKLPSPLYTAVIEWLPTDSDVVLNVAVPLDSVPVPSAIAALSKNVTVPVGVPAFAVTVAVNVTGWPKLLALSEEVSVVEGTS
jgi:hypothetical protein